MPSRRTERTSRHRGSPVWHIIEHDGRELLRTTNQYLAGAFLRGFNGYHNGKEYWPTPYDAPPRYKYDLQVFHEMFSDMWMEGWEAAEEIHNADAER